MSSSTSRLVVLAGPTAVAKGTVAAYVRRTFPDVWVSVSMTTRKARPRQVDKKHYHFVDDERFERKRAQGEFLEWAVVHGQAKYGTPRAPVDEALAAGAEGPLTSASAYTAAAPNRANLSQRRSPRPHPI